MLVKFFAYKAVWVKLTQIVPHQSLPGPAVSQKPWYSTLHASRYLLHAELIHRQYCTDESSTAWSPRRKDIIFLHLHLPHPSRLTPALLGLIYYNNNYYYYFNRTFGNTSKTHFEKVASIFFLIIFYHCFVIIILYRHIITICDYKVVKKNHLCVFSRVYFAIPFCLSSL